MQVAATEKGSLGHTERGSSRDFGRSRIRLSLLFGGMIVGAFAKPISYCTVLTAASGPRGGAVRCGREERREKSIVVPGSRLAPETSFVG